MGTIDAVGYIDGRRITVHVDGKLKVTFKNEDGRDDKSLWKAFKALPLRSIGGTYFPPRKSHLNYYNQLKNHFFDKVEEISVTGDIGTIPYKEGVVY